MIRPHALLAITLLFASAAAAQTQRYIIPVWANDLQGATQTWTSEAQVSNASGEVVTMRVAAVYPALAYFFCHPIIFCGPQVAQPLFPGDSLVVRPDFFEENIAYRLAAFVLETDAPVKIEAWVRGITSDGLINQEIEIVRDWIDPDAKAFIPERYYHIGGGVPDRTNLFVINPNNKPLELSWRAEYRGIHRPPDLEGTLTVPPGSLSGAEAIPAYRAEDGTDLPVFPRIHLVANGPYHAVASDVDARGDVLFRSPAVAPSR